MLTPYPVSKIAQKNSLKECIFVVNSALKIQFHVVNNTLLQTSFLAILPNGRDRFGRVIKKTCILRILYLIEPRMFFISGSIFFF